MKPNHLRKIFIAGAAKSGTTSLYQIMAKHPQVCVPVVKEPNFYGHRNNGENTARPGTGPGDRGTVWVDSYSHYRSLFKPQPDHRFQLDGSVSYLYSDTAAADIYSAQPGAKIIIVLRNPVDRAFSHYKHLVRDGRESLSFEEALEQEETRREKGWEFSWHLKNMGMYGEQISRYLNYFDRNDLRFFLFEDLITDFPAVLRSVTDFTGISAFGADITPEKENQSGLSKSRNLARFMNWAAGYKLYLNKVLGPSFTHGVMQRLRKLNMRDEKMQLSAETRKRLCEYFRKDIENTESLIGRDLSTWKN